MLLADLPDVDSDDSLAALLLDYSAVDSAAPERRLISAVILAAFRDYARGDISARAWLGSHSLAPFSYAWCCDMLGVDSAALLERARAALPVISRVWTARMYRKIAGASRPAV